MKSVNYSFNSSLLVDFMLLWHLKMEASQLSGPIRGCTQMRKSWWKADDAMHSLRPRDKLPLYLASSKEIYWRELKEISHSG